MKVLRKFITSKKSRLLSIFLPILVLILTFITLAPKIGFILFPSGDNPFIFVTVESTPGDAQDSFVEKLGNIEPIISSIPELKFYTIGIGDDSANVSLELTKKSERDAQ